MTRAARTRQLLLASESPILTFSHIRAGEGIHQIVDVEADFQFRALIALRPRPRPPPAPDCAPTLSRSAASCQPYTPILLVRQDGRALESRRSRSRSASTILLGLVGTTPPYSGKRPSISFEVNECRRSAREHDSCRIRVPQTPPGPNIPCSSITPFPGTMTWRLDEIFGFPAIALVSASARRCPSVATQRSECSRRIEQHAIEVIAHILMRHREAGAYLPSGDFSAFAFRHGDTRSTSASMFSMTGNSVAGIRRERKRRRPCADYRAFSGFAH